MADRIIQAETLQSIANALRGGASQSDADKIEVADFAEVAQNLKTNSEALKSVIDRSVVSVNIPSGATQIGNEAFADCTSLASVTIPNSVTSIGYGAFRTCTSLASVTIPNSVTSIDANAFNNCTSLASVTIPTSVTSIGANVFSKIKSDAVINCGFSEGAVSGAPWGAPSGVTINYDVTPQA